MRELAGQLSEEDKAPLIFLAVGSAGTLAGCARIRRSHLSIHPDMVAGQ